MKDSLEDSYHVNMLVTLLLRFPEIFTITFNMASSSCRLSYMIKRELQQDEYLSLRQKLEENLEAFYYFNDHEEYRFNIRRKRFRGLTQLQIILGGDHLLGETISLLTKTMRDALNEDLIGENRADDDDTGWIESTATVEEMPARFPATASSRKVNHLIAFRDAGKVYVFDK